MEHQLLIPWVYVWGEFDSYTDNNPLSYILTTAKLDATGQKWVAGLANYNFRIHYKSGKQNVEMDALSWIPWRDEENARTLDQLTIKAIIDMGTMGKEALFESFAGDGMITELEKEMQSTKDIPLVSKILRMKVP